MKKQDTKIIYDDNIYSINTELKIVNMKKCDLDKQIAISNFRNEIIKQIALTVGPVTAGYISGNFNNNPNHFYIGVIFSSIFLIDLAIHGFKELKDVKYKELVEAKNLSKKAEADFDEYISDLANYIPNDINSKKQSTVEYIDRTDIADSLLELIDYYMVEYNIRKCDIQISDLKSVINTVFLAYRYNGIEEEFYIDMCAALRSMIASNILYKKDTIELKDFIIGLEFITNPKADFDMLLELQEDLLRTYSPKEKDLHL